MDYLDTKGRIFDIQKYSVHDGPGIRTIVFLKLRSPLPLVLQPGITGIPDPEYESSGRGQSDRPGCNCP